MSKSQKAPQYKVRMFDAFNEGSFDSFGVIEKFKTFDTIQVRTQAEAIIEMLRGTGASLSSRCLSALNVDDDGMLTRYSGSHQHIHHLSIIDASTDKTIPIEELMIIDIKAHVSITKDEIADIRPAVVECFERWAEKSRVRGSRGWRVSAVRNPRFEAGWEGDEFDGYTLRAQIIIGTAIFYDQSTVKIGIDKTTEPKNVRDLVRHLRSVTNNTVKDIVVNHSGLGSLEFIAI